jgi:DICT domain-containing protein
VSHSASRRPVPEGESASRGVPGLTIGDLVERTGVPAATLRTWESRYGAPRAARLPSGHRRFADSDVDLVVEISRLRSTGLALPTAIAHATKTAEAPADSLFHGLISRHPSLRIQVLRKRTLLALTRAVEQECCARAERPLLFAGFQRESYYVQSQERWTELARTADAAFVFADFRRPSLPDERPIRLSLPESAPLQREWLVVCDDARLPACVIGTELPGQSQVGDSERRFETVWSLDPTVVRDAARVCAGVAASLQPGAMANLGDRLAGIPREGSSDLARTHGLFSRLVGNLDTV